MYAIPCMFEPSGWVWHRLTPKEWLSIHDFTLRLAGLLESDLAARLSMGLAFPALIIGEIFHVLWGSESWGYDRLMTGAIMPTLERRQMTAKVIPQQKHSDTGNMTAMVAPKQKHSDTDNTHPVERDEECAHLLAI